MASNSENNFYRLIALMVDVSYDVVREYFKKVLGAESFETFLSRNHHQLYHLFNARECCKCLPRQRIIYPKCLTEDQLKLMYDNNGNKIHKDKYCCCIYSAKQNVTVAVLDISLAFIILKNCTHLPSGIEYKLGELKKIRNELFHKSDVNSITEDEFKILWQHMRDLTLSLSSEIDSSFKNKISAKIFTLYGRVIVNDDLLNKCILLHDYWRDKYLEIEKLQQWHFSAIEQRFTELETEQQKNADHNTAILSRIDDLTNKVNNIKYTVEANERFINLLKGDCVEKQDGSGKLTIPVLVMIDVPDHWDHSQIITALTRIQDSLDAIDGNLKIRSFSLEDIKMLLDIKQTVLQNPENFKKSLHDFMTTFLKESDIDQSKECNIKLEVQSIGEEETKIPLEDLHKSVSPEVPNDDDNAAPNETQTEVKVLDIPNPVITRSLSANETRVEPGLDHFLAWVPTHGSNIPPNAVQGGQDKNNNNRLFVARARINSNWWPGKAGWHLQGGHIGSDSIEKCYPDYEVLTIQPEAKHRLSWQQDSNGHVPNNAVPVCDSSNFFIGRHEHGGGLHPGRIDQNEQSIYVPCDWTEHPYSDYEVLVYDTLC